MTRKVIPLFLLLFALAFAAPASATIASVQSQSVVFGNGATTVFNANFTPDTSSSIQVIYTNPSGVSTTLSPSQYTVTIPNPPVGQIWPQGFSVTYPLSGSPIPNGSSLTIQRIIPLQQLTAISQQGNFYPKVVEQALDVGVMQSQQINARTGALRGTWLTNTQYNVGDVVKDGAGGLNSGNYYTCAIANTSGTWTTDLGNGDWSLSLPAAIPNTPLPLSITNGGTGASTAGAALNNLGGIALSGNNAFTGTNTFSQNVGINTASVLNPLGVGGGVAIGTSYQSTSAPSNGEIIQGLVGIGTSLPLRPLHISNPVEADVLLEYSSGLANSRIWRIYSQSSSGVAANLTFDLLNDNATSGVQAMSINGTTGIVNFNNSPTAPTPTTNDNSTNIATTAFVNPANSLGASGYQKISSGLIVQWGQTGTISSSPKAITLPVTFPNSGFVGFYSPSSTGSNSYGGVVNISTTTINVWVDNPGASGYWMAIGY